MLCCVLQVVWAGRHTLASASDKERLVRLFDFDSEDNYVLNTDTEAGASSTVAALAYDARWAAVRRAVICCALLDG